MKYRELKSELEKLTQEQLDCDVTVYIPWDCEYLPIDNGLWFADPLNGVLDENHPIIYVKDIEF